ncbi:MAG: tetratricopeptide repeat protein [Candidatus Thorarchaeota archaeon]
MKPLGTITMCYPYVDEETRDILELVMNEAKNFGDFTEKLCDRVISEPSSPLTEYLLFSFAYWLEHHGLIDRLDAAGKVPDIARPILLILKAERGLSLNWKEVKASLVKALNLAPNDWIATHLYLQWRMFTDQYFSEADVDFRPLETVAAALKENSELHYFESYLHWITAGNLEKENDKKGAIAVLKQALAIARKFDDQVYVACLLSVIGALTRHTDLKQAVDLLISARKLSEELGYTFQIGLVQGQLGRIMEVRGEFDAAIEYQREFMEYRKSLGSLRPVANAVLASYYNQMGNGEMALELTNKALAPEDVQFPWFSYSNAQHAWALINLERHAEAQKALATCQRVALKSGGTVWIVWYYLVEGLLDKAEKRFENAVINFQKVLNFIDDDPVPFQKNICLLNLTEIEIDMLTDTSLHEDLDSSGRWMTKLEEYLQKNDFPGITALSMILRAKLRYRQGKYDEVREILKEVQEIGNKPSMRYINDLIVTKFPDVIVA